MRRLEQTGFLEKKRILKGKNSRDTIVVLKSLRPPNEDDVKYINYRRKAPRHGDDGFVVEGDDGDDLMKDLELDLDQVYDDRDAEKIRMPPQWSPDRLFANLAFQAIDMAGPEGIDASAVRDKTMGKFWKRPTESFISRLTDNWETSQPPHLRHLAIIRDTIVTVEKKLLHYVYRTHGNFQKAVDNKTAKWEVVSREAMKKSSTEKRGRPEKHDHEKTLNRWGFPDLNMLDFQQRNGLRGASSLAECNSAVKKARKNGPRWDISLLQDLGTKKRGRPPKQVADTLPSIAKTPHMAATGDSNSDGSQRLPSLSQEQPDHTADGPGIPKRAPRSVRKTKQLAVPLLSAEQREALNLPPRGRLGTFIEDQIRAHREKVGDPSALPEVLYTDPSNMPGYVKSKEKRGKKKPVETKLFTKAFRRKHGLPENGKLHQSVIDHFRQLEREGKLDPTAEPATEAPGTPIPLEAGPTTPGEGVEECEPSPLVGTKRKADEIPTPEESPKRLRIEAESNPDALAQANLPTDQSTSTSLNLTVPIAPMLTPASQTPTSPTQPAGQTVSNAKKSSGEAHNLEDSAAGSTPAAADIGTSDAQGSLTSKTSKWMPRTVRKSKIPSSTDPAMKNLETPDRPVSQPAPKEVNPTVSGKDKQKARDARLQTLVNQFDKRSEPGVYFDPTATRPVPRGRPRKGFLAVFKSDKLFGKEWFKFEASDSLSPEVQENFHTAQSHAAEVNRNDTETFAPHTPATRRTSRSSFDGSIRQSVQDLAHGGTRRTPSEAFPEAEAIEVDEENSETHGRRQVTPVEVPVADMGVATRNGSRERDQLAVNVRPGSGWNAVNGYQSPYPSVTSQSTPNNGWTTVNNPLINRLSNDPENVDKTAAYDEDYEPENDIAEQTSGAQTFVKLQELGKRGVVLGQGYVWRLRTEIVCEILDMCGGLFPFNGEIIDPLYTLWKERAPKMPPPDRTTVSTSINRMLQVQELGLWKLTFSVSTKEGAKKTVDKHIIGRKDVSKDDPRVLEMKEGIAKAYPKKFYPAEVRHLAGPEPVQRKPLEAEFDDSITFEGVQPSADQKLDQRIMAAKNDRKRMLAEKKKNQVQDPSQRSVRSGGTGKARPRRLDTISGKPRHKKNMPEFVFDDSESSSDESDTMLEIMTGIEPSGTHSGGFVNLGPSGWLYKLQDAEKALLAPDVRFNRINGTFTTHFGGSPVKKTAVRRKITAPKPEKPVNYIFIMEENPQGTKRKQVQFAEGPTSNKRIRLSGNTQATVGGSSHRGKFQQVAQPTLVERLSGRTGNPDDPIYVAPKKKNYRNKAKAWIPVEPGRGKARKAKREAAEREIADSVDPAHKFKKVFCTLTIATCMSAEEGRVEWSIVEKVISKESGYSLEKTRRLWLWIQAHMGEQLKFSKDRFQAAFLHAYENGKVPSIERIESYDWVALVRWALRTYEQPELPLPLKAEALHDFVVEESHYRAFNRRDWSQKAPAHVVRAQRLLKYAYAMPLSSSSGVSTTDDDMRARSWIRANIATAPKLYSSIVAHDKLSKLGNSALQPIVTDMVKEGLIKQRKVKRLLPGRNFDFAPKAAGKYRCLYDQEVYMEAVHFKKSMDAAFLHESSALRYITVSKTAPNGVVMALLSLFSEGQVELVPILPPVNNELGAPPPRLSVWGFMEGDYVHRKIDRKRLFWDVRVVPTDKYKFGNPLIPCSKDADENPMIWKPLPLPPLPGKEDENAILPIWSSLEGDGVTWGWWYRILHITLQSLMFQPGISPEEIYRQLAPGAAELFEVEMVLNWLVDCNAATKSGERSYAVAGGFWAAFGETLHIDKDDWFGEHVKRSKYNQGVRQPWKLQYNVVSQRVSAILHGEGEDGMYVGRGDEQDGDDGEEGNEVLPFAFNTTSTLQERAENTKAKELQNQGDGDVEMVDADA